MAVNSQRVETHLPVEDWRKKFRDVWNQTDELL